MKTIILMALIAFSAASSEYYQLKRIDMVEIINNPDDFKRFLDCELERGECTKLYSTYQAVTAEAVAEICRRCSPYQKHSFWLFLQEVIARFPSDYNNFRKKYDPENKYFDALESELRKYSITY